MGPFRRIKRPEVVLTPFPGDVSTECYTPILFTLRNGFKGVVIKTNHLFFLFLNRAETLWEPAWRQTQHRFETLPPRLKEISGTKQIFHQANDARHTR